MTSNYGEASHDQLLWKHIAMQYNNGLKREYSWLKHSLNNTEIIKNRSNYNYNLVYPKHMSHDQLLWQRQQLLVVCVQVCMRGQWGPWTCHTRRDWTR